MVIRASASAVSVGPSACCEHLGAESSARSGPTRLCRELSELQLSLHARIGIGIQCALQQSEQLIHDEPSAN